MDFWNVLLESDVPMADNEVICEEIHEEPRQVSHDGNNIKTYHEDYHHRQSNIMLHQDHSQNDSNMKYNESVQMEIIQGSREPILYDSHDNNEYFVIRDEKVYTDMNNYDMEQLNYMNMDQDSLEHVRNNAFQIQDHQQGMYEYQKCEEALPAFNKITIKTAKMGKHPDYSIVHHPNRPNNSVNTQNTDKKWPIIYVKASSLPTFSTNRKNDDSILPVALEVDNKRQKENNTVVEDNEEPIETIEISDDESDYEEREACKKEQSRKIDAIYKHYRRLAFGIATKEDVDLINDKTLGSLDYGRTRKCYTKSMPIVPQFNSRMENITGRAFYHRLGKNYEFCDTPLVRFSNKEKLEENKLMRYLDEHLGLPYRHWVSKKRQDSCNIVSTPTVRKTTKSKETIAFEKRYKLSMAKRGRVVDISKDFEPPPPPRKKKSEEVLYLDMVNVSFEQREKGKQWETLHNGTVSTNFEQQCDYYQYEQASDTNEQFYEVPSQDYPQYYMENNGDIL